MTYPEIKSNGFTARRCRTSSCLTEQYGLSHTRQLIYISSNLARTEARRDCRLPQAINCCTDLTGVAWYYSKYARADVTTLYLSLLMHDVHWSKTISQQVCQGCLHVIVALLKGSCCSCGVKAHGHQLLHSFWRGCWQRWR